MANYRVIRFDEKNSILTLEVNGNRVLFPVPITDGLYPEGQALITILDGFVANYLETYVPRPVATNPEVVHGIVETPPTEILKQNVRAKRNLLLRLCDWTQAKDSSLTPEQVAAWANYRMQLKNVPEQFGFPDSVVWPTPPAPLYDMYGLELVDTTGATTRDLNLKV